jgi:DNA-binding MarR family transcriptional regulator
MNVLSVEQRQFIVRLYRDEQRTQTEIAELLGVTQSNVSKVLAQARRRDPQIPKRRRAARSPIVRRPRIFAASQFGSSRQPLDLDYV